MMKPTPLLAVALFAAAALPAMAQHNHGAHGAKPMATAAAEDMADGEIRNIDAAKGALLIKHGVIKSINMGAMTMEFKLKDAAMATGLKKGDKVRFAVEMQGQDLIVTKIQKAN
jgi:Cu(I)/Ag(I) efflux system periplasmic protein CusF